MQQICCLQKIKPYLPRHLEPPSRQWQTNNFLRVALWKCDLFKATMHMDFHGRARTGCLSVSKYSWDPIFKGLVTMVQVRY